MSHELKIGVLWGPNGSFPKSGGPNIDPNILYVILGTPNLGKPPNTIVGMVSAIEKKPNTSALGSSGPSITKWEFPKLGVPFWGSLY